MAAKKRVWRANLNFGLQSESYRSVLAIMHFCDAFYTKIKIIQVLFVFFKWAIRPSYLMDCYVTLTQLLYYSSTFYTSRRVKRYKNIMFLYTLAWLFQNILINFTSTHVTHAYCVRTIVNSIGWNISLVFFSNCRLNLKCHLNYYVTIELTVLRFFA